MPRVSVIVPARNEERYIEACIDSILGQEVDGGLEVIVADGRSTDATRARAQRAGAYVVDNAAGTIPAGLNAALNAAKGEVIVRFDAHAEMPTGYVAACLRALAEEEDAANVGGWRKAAGLTPWGRAVGIALASSAGVGHARIWRAPGTGTGRVDVDTVPLGAFPTEVLRAAGGWREELLANEDYELNHRLRERGGRVIFDPEIWSVYRPRESLSAVAEQYWRYGTWKAEMLADHPESLRARQLAPLAVLALAAAAPLSRAARVALAAYLAGLATLAARGRQWRLAPTLAAMHLPWAAGLAWGLTRRSVASPGPGVPEAARRGRERPVV